MLKLLLTTYLLLILTHLYHRQDHFHGKLFISMLTTPTLKRKKTKRHQMISSKGIKMVKCLFRKMPRNLLQKTLAEKSKEVSPKQGIRQRNRKYQQYHFLKIGKLVQLLCSISAVVNMRICIKCGIYVHEDSVKLSAHDEEIFILPSCED